MGKEGFENILKEWKKFNCVLGSMVEITDPKETLEGKALNVDDSGALLIKLSDGRVKRIINSTLKIKNYYEKTECP